MTALFVVQMPICQKSQEQILANDEVVRPLTSPASLKHRLATIDNGKRGAHGPFSPLNEKSEERLFRSWQFYTEENEDPISNEENKGHGESGTNRSRCATADLPSRGCAFPGVIALDWFLPSLHRPAVGACSSSSGVKQLSFSGHKVDQKSTKLDAFSSPTMRNHSYHPPRMPWAAGARCGTNVPLPETPHLEDFNINCIALLHH